MAKGNHKKAYTAEDMSSKTAPTGRRLDSFHKRQSLTFVKVLFFARTDIPCLVSKKKREYRMVNRKDLGFLALMLAAIVQLPRVASAQAPTFSKDVAPIFQEKCEACHRPDSIAPMSLVTYQEARPWAKAIKERVITRSMPPWHMDKTVGIQHFANDRSLSDQQIDTIVR